MTPNKILDCAQALQGLIRSRHEWNSEEEAIASKGLIQICGNIKTHVQKGKFHKASRQLGFVQGVLCAYGEITFQELKNMNSPHGSDQGSY